MILPILYIMWSRNDAGLAAAELALAVEKFVLESGSIDTVGTVGKELLCTCLKILVLYHQFLVNGKYRLLSMGW